MTFSKEQIEALKAPLNKAFVKERSQAGRQLSYIEGWKAIDEANRIFGFDRWDRRTEEMRLLSDPIQVDGKWRVYYAAKVRIHAWTPDAAEQAGVSIDRDGWGYGSGIDRDLGQAHESALKEAETDAMKRALMTFGNPFGLALYDKEQKNVVAEPAPSVDTAALYTAIETEMSSALTLQQLNGVMKRRMNDILSLPEGERDNLRQVARFKGEALKKFGEAAE